MYDRSLDLVVVDLAVAHSNTGGDLMVFDMGHLPGYHALITLLTEYALSKAIIQRKLCGNIIYKEAIHAPSVVSNVHKRFIPFLQL